MKTGITATPCGQCDNCREIEQGRFVDLIEIDAASRTKVEDTRDLLDNVQYAPARGRFKVYLIDEVHMLAPQLQRVAEDAGRAAAARQIPVGHHRSAKAAGDHSLALPAVPPQGAGRRSDPPAVGNGADGGADHQRRPCAAAAARAADGSMRDALSLTDQAIAMGQGR